MNVYVTFNAVEARWCEGMDWIHLADNRGQWWALMNLAMKLRIP